MYIIFFSNKINWKAKAICDSMNEMEWQRSIKWKSQLLLLNVALNYVQKTGWMIRWALETKKKWEMKLNHISVFETVICYMLNLLAFYGPILWLFYGYDPAIVIIRWLNRFYVHLGKKGNNAFSRQTNEIAFMPCNMFSISEWNEPQPQSLGALCTKAWPDAKNTLYRCLLSPTMIYMTVFLRIVPFDLYIYLAIGKYGKFLWRFILTLHARLVVVIMVLRYESNYVIRNTFYASDYLRY